MKKFLLMLAAISALFATPARADLYDEAMAAYERGDFDTAVKALRSVAEQGNPGAMSALALMYDVGHGVPQDSAEAVKWYRRAAQLGEKSAQYNLASMYDAGVGVPQDSLRAYVWFALSIASGNASAASERDAEAKKLSPEQLTTAKNIVAECLQRRYSGCD